ncbi:MAG: ThiF family adenylyltransferase [Candidatus Thermoplasmatota archaeon]|jgi:molybdopterin/thiamine biosynthesis adenylyltransferase
MRRRILIKKADWDEISRAFDAEERETAAYALIGVSRTANTIDYLVREVFFLTEQDYHDRNRVHLLIAPAFINQMAGRCERQGLGLLAMHSHPMQSRNVQFSMSDNWGEARELQVFHHLGDGKWPLVSLVRGTAAVKAREWDFRGAQGKSTPVDELVIVGDQLTRVPMGHDDRLRTRDFAVHDRQVRALGADGQHELENSAVAIIGAGGTGSACAEMLARLGVGRIILMDDDILEESNLSRVYGSTPSDVGKPKVQILKKWLSKVSPTTKIEAHQVNLVGHTALLKEADVVLGCTDTETSRALANQFACQYMRPFIDMGNRIDAQNGRIQAASARMTFVVPDGPCMECFGNINHATVQTENLSPAEYKRLRKEGYVAGLDEKAPSVISLNTFVASLAITKLLDVLTGAGGLPHAKYTYSYLEGDLRAARVRRRDKCICRFYEAYGDMRQLETRAT